MGPGRAVAGGATRQLIRTRERRIVGKLKMLLFIAKYRKYLIPGVVVVVAVAVYFLFFR